MIIADSGGHFDPTVVEAFSSIGVAELEEIGDRLR